MEGADWLITLEFDDGSCFVSKKGFKTKSQAFAAAKAWAAQHLPTEGTMVMQ